MNTSDITHRVVFLCNEAGDILHRSSDVTLTWLQPLSGPNLFSAPESVPEHANLVGRWQELTRLGKPFQLPLRFPVNVGEPEAILLSAYPWSPPGHDALWLVTVEQISSTVFDHPHEMALGRAVLHSAVDAIITITHSGTIHSVNPATSRMFGYSPDDLLGKNVSMLMPEPYKSEHDEYLARYLNTRRGSIIGVGRRVTGRRANGTEFPIHLAVSEFQVGGRIYFTGIVRDLTELDLVQRQLLQSERLAAIGQMVTGLAHESRNALQRAQAFLDMLSLDLEDQPEQLHLARRATAALQQLHRLYEEVRGYAAPIHLEFRECRISGIWRKEWDHLQEARQGKNILVKELPQVSPPPEQTLVEDPADGCPDGTGCCEVDIHRLEQVFRNILENAIHACGDEGLVEISCNPTTWNQEPALEIVIADNGCGLTEAAASHIFEPFFTTKQKGTGLGMAIVHRIVTAHGGEITAHPRSPRGSEIRLVLPRYRIIRNAFRSG